MKQGFEAPTIGETDVERKFFGEKPMRRDRRQVASEAASERVVTESKTERLRQSIEAKTDTETPPLPWTEDFSNSAISPEGQVRLTASEYKKLNRRTDSFFEEVKDSKTAITSGYDVATSYDSHIQSYTTRTKIIDIDGKKAFALCSYPASMFRRLSDRFMERFSDDPMRKPKPEKWKETVESRSNIPTIAGTPDNMVLMPYIESINAYDVFANHKEIKDFGAFGWAKELTVEEKIALAKQFAETLKETHDSGRTWGESILPNIILTKEKKPILIDAETTYEGIDVPEQKATDVRNLISSISGALARSEGISDFSPIVREVLSAYPDSNIRSELKKICSAPQPWRQRLIFNAFSRFRVGASDLNEFERVKKTILQVLDEKE